MLYILSLDESQWEKIFFSQYTVCTHAIVYLSQAQDYDILFTLHNVVQNIKAILLRVVCCKRSLKPLNVGVNSIRPGEKAKVVCILTGKVPWTTKSARVSPVNRTHS